jgi:hypothetical protein
MAAVLAQNGAYQGAIAAILSGRDISESTEAVDYTTPAAAANAFALQVSATVGVISTSDQQLLLQSICFAALQGRGSIKDTSTSLPNSYQALSVAIHEAYTQSVGNLTS